MRLDDWRKGRGMTYADLGLQLGLPLSTARRYCVGARMPRAWALMRIREVTAGDVGADDFLPAPNAPAPKPEDLL